MFVSTDDGVVVFDTLGVDAARQLAAEIQRTAPGSPLAGIVYSHSDADHGAVTASLAVSPHPLPDSVDPCQPAPAAGPDVLDHLPGEPDGSRGRCRRVRRALERQ